MNTDALQLKSWYIRGNSSDRGILIAKYYDDYTSVPDNLDVKIERFAGSTIDDIYIAPTSVTPDFARQLLSKKLDISTFDSTAVSHFENDKYYTSFMPTSPKVGDYLYSDGTISTDVISGKTAVAVCVAPPWQFEDHKARFVGINQLGAFKWASTSNGGYYLYDHYGSIYDLKTNALFDRNSMFNSIVALHLPTDIPVGTVRKTDSYNEYRVAVQNGNSYVLAFGISSGEQIGDDARLGNAPQLNADSSEYPKINPLYKYEGSALSDLDGEGHTQILATYYKASTSFPAFFTANSQQAISGNNWYIPAMGELAYVFANINVINAKINAVGGTPIITSTTGETLMSSTMAYSNSTIYKMSTLYGTVDTGSKTTSYTTRAFIKADATFGNVEYDDIYLGFITKNDLTTVAKTGSYNDLIDKPVIPTIPTNVSVPVGTSTLSAEVEKYYTFADNVETMDIILPTPSGSNIQSISFFMTTGANPAITFTSTGNTIYKNDGFVIDASTTYEIKALWNGSAWIINAVKYTT